MRARRKTWYRSPRSPDVYAVPVLLEPSILRISDQQLGSVASGASSLPYLACLNTIPALLRSYPITYTAVESTATPMTPATVPALQFG